MIYDLTSLYSHLVNGERHDGVILLQHGLLAQLLKVVGAYPVMSVCCQDLLAVSSVGQTLDSDALPAVEKYMIYKTVHKVYQ